jgi:hypothetical protein
VCSSHRSCVVEKFPKLEFIFIIFFKKVFILAGLIPPRPLSLKRYYRDTIGIISDLLETAKEGRGRMEVSQR